MPLLPPILADFDDYGKVIIGIIVFVIWGIGALANLAKKQTRPSDQSQLDMEQAMRAQIEEARRREAAQAQMLGQMYGQASRPPLPPPPILQPQQQQPMRPRQRGPAVPPMRNLPSTPPPRPAVRAPAVPPPPVRRPGPITQPGRGQPQRQQAKKKQQQQRRPQAPALPELAPLPQSLAGQLTTPGVRESEIGTGVTAASPARRAAAAGPALRLTARGLRHQFILTEILQPPLALRDHPPGA